MRVLAVDIGTGTQDILLFDSSEPIENAVQLILPSPTLVVAGRIRAATAAGQAVLLTGTLMGGGPCHWAAVDHLRAGYAVYATPAAARTFDDDLAGVAAMGVSVVDDGDAAARIAGGAVPVVMRDFDPGAILAALAGFGVDPSVDALAVAVFDHGDAPPGVSDRRFRFDYLAERLQAGARSELADFAFMRDAIPPTMTRMQAAAASATGPLADLPLLAMDTGPAAVLGALEDGAVRAAAAGQGALVVNAGNFHTLAFHLTEGKVAGLFEHHTGELTEDQLSGLLARLAAGTLTNAEVFDTQGHGALVLDPSTRAPQLCAVTGPRRQKVSSQQPWPVHLAVPHGDMMLTGCFALLRALAHHWAPAREAITAGL
ncbi:MAG TPA: DUF1786 domain-containing protein [Chloroflexia bacterium]|nr:DUF1786 domain-containing protein [Chloroflexia bacterium]